MVWGGTKSMSNCVVVAWQAGLVACLLQLGLRVARLLWWGQPLAVQVQFIYFSALVIWIGCRGDCTRFLVLLSGIGFWMGDRHLPRHLCRCVSLGIGIWLTADAPLVVRGGLLLPIGMFPAYPEDARLRSLRSSVAAPMDIDLVSDDASGLKQGLTSSSSLRSGADSAPMDLDEGSQEVDARVARALATLFGEDVPKAQLLREESGTGAHASARSKPCTCPVLGCARHVDRDGIGFPSFGALRAHVLHLGHELYGSVPEGWLGAQNLSACRICGLSISSKIRDCIHLRCRSRLATPSHPFFFPLPAKNTARYSPALYSSTRNDAWDLQVDSEAKQRCRRAWVEFFMFGKCCLRQASRGERPSQAYHFTQSLLLLWKAGDRYGLWLEARAAGERRSRKGVGGKGKRSHVSREVERLVSLGRSGEAGRRLVSPGLAEDTPQVRQRLLAKIPPRDGPVISSDGVAPPPDIPADVVYKAIFSLKKGAGPGPGGDFLRDLLSQHPEKEEPLGLIYREFVQLLVNAEAPSFLRSFLGGGRLVGVGKKDSEGRHVALDADARPIVLGMTWRKVAFRCTLALDRDSIRDRLGDHQLALTRGGADVLVHAARGWVRRHCSRDSAVVFQKDVRNAFNEIRPREFLQDCRAHAPTSARFAHFCYGDSTHLVYGDNLEGSHRGQQGCPLMAPMFCLSRRRMFDLARAECRRVPEFEVEFADDAYSAGEVEDVLIAFKAEIALSERFGLHFDFSKCTLYFLAGEQFRGDISEFQAFGVRVVTGSELAILKTPVHGTAAFGKTFLAAKIRELQEMADAIQQLPTKHVAFHLLREALSWGKIQYWARTSPREYISTLLEVLHTIQRQCLEGILGKPLTSAQWLQSRLPDRCGGLGLLACRYEQGMQVFQVADLAYLVSRRQSHSHVARLVPGYEQVVPTLEASAIQHLTAFLPIGQDEINHPEHALDQSQILDRMYNSVFQILFDGSTLSI